MAAFPIMSIDPTRNNALIWWNITLDNVLMEIDQLAYYCEEHNDHKRLDDLQILITQKASTISEISKRLLNVKNSVDLNESIALHERYKIPGTEKVFLC